MKRIVRTQFGYLLFGVIAWLPIAVIIFMGAALFGGVDSAGKKVLELFLPERYFFTGIGFLLAVAVIYLTGVVLKATSAAGLFSRIPLVGMFFGKRRGGVMTLNRLMNLKPCLFLFSPTCPSYGWILSVESVEAAGQKGLYEFVNVYYPNVPTMVVGSIFPVRKDAVILLGNTSREVLDLLFYSLRSPDTIKLTPWKDESPENLLERARRFGLTPPCDVDGVVTL